VKGLAPAIANFSQASADHWVLRLRVRSKLHYSPETGSSRSARQAIREALSRAGTLRQDAGALNGFWPTTRVFSAIQRKRMVISS